MTDEELNALATRLDEDFLKLFGSPVVTGEQLQKALGFKSIDALRQAISRKKMPVPVFELENRRGKYALTKDIAKYLAEQARFKKEVNK
jgi:hypothetical protein